MNFNASRNVNHGSGLRKAKRVSDVSAMGAPSPTPGFNQPPPAYSPGYPAAAQPQYQEGINVDSHRGFGSPSPPPAGDFGFGMGGFPQAPMTSPTQIGAMLQQPVVQDMALQYGNQLAAHGKQVVAREVSRFIPVTQLRCYFAVDTRYVLKKLMLITFPFTHKDWMVKYEQQAGGVAPRYEVNALDLYIPAMGYVTYVLLAGFMLGLQHMFSPEQIGLLASSALAYLALELVVHALSRAAAGVTTLSMLDLAAASGYKFVAMVTALLAATLVGKTGYYVVLGYCSFALAYFLVKTLRMQVLSGAQTTEQPPSYSYAAQQQWPQQPTSGTKRRMYFLLTIAVAQPLLSWWLTYHLVPNNPVLAVDSP